MKRSRILLTSALVFSVVVAGCGGDGIKEGMSTESATPSGQPAGFEEMMKQNAEKMKMKGRPKSAPAIPKEKK